MQIVWAIHRLTLSRFATQYLPDNTSDKEHNAACRHSSGNGQSPPWALRLGLMVEKCFVLLTANGPGDAQPP